MLEKLLKIIGNDDLGKTVMPTDWKFNGQAIALSERRNGNKTYVIVSWMNDKLVVKCDPYCMKSPLARLIEVYTYGEVDEAPTKTETQDQSEAPTKTETSDTDEIPIDKMNVEQVTAALKKQDLTDDEIDGIGNLKQKKEVLKRILAEKLA